MKKVTAAIELGCGLIHFECLVADRALIVAHSDEIVGRAVVQGHLRLELPALLGHVKLFFFH